ncbi:MAG: hypothetical protein ACM3VS_14010 [Candidatus Dadabacteria bacterium]
MKLLLLIITVASLSAKSCQKGTINGNCYKGRLEIQGACLNYTIKLIEGNIDTSLIVTKWTNQSTGKQYSNVFSLVNPCLFPETIKEGDEFYFTIDRTQSNDCVTCLIFYPKPEKSLPIRVLTKPCKP